MSSGSFGAVYRASDRQIENHQVALKLLHAPAADEPAREAALRELTLLASVSHPSVVQFKDYGWHEGRLWFAMPWYRGETLAMRYIDAAGGVAMTRLEARPIFERLAQGLAAMHEVGIHHHDIKPENVFLADIAGFDVGFPVLLDLGIAAKRGEGPKGLTVEYASPETAATALGVRDRTIGAASDIFSLALVLRNALEPDTALPQEGEFLALLNQRATVAISPPRRREFRHLRAAFARWLNLDPSKRPTASEFASELSLLTLPEEQRQARRRILRRLVPVLFMSALAVTVLLLQVRRQKTEIQVQRQRLSQEMEQSQQLRQRSTEQLQEIEVKSQQLGSQAQQLMRAIAIGRELNGQLATAEARANDLTNRLRTTTEAKDALTADKAALTQERDRVQAERDELVKAKDALAAERDRIDAARRDAETARDTLTAERDRLRADLSTSRDALDKATAELEQQQRTVKDQKAELRSLQRRLRKAERKAAKRADATTTLEGSDDPSSAEQVAPPPP